MSTESKPARHVYFFGQGQADGGSEVRRLVGGKGASLADMTRAGLDVPPGFTISAACCDHFFRSGRTWPEGLEAEVRHHLARLEQVTGRPFGRGDQPLLVSVRSGAAESMPGMMDTLLNVGLNPDCVRATASRTGRPRDAWEAYRHFLAAFGQLAAGIEEPLLARVAADFLRERGKTSEGELDAREMEGLCERLLSAFPAHAGRPMPADPWEMLRAAIDAVFRSWENERAVAYREHHHLQGLLGTAVTVQAMVPSEVSGVMFTANPVNADLDQVVIEAAPGLGEAVVLGKVTPDRFLIDRRRPEVVQRDPAAAPARANGEPCLSDAQVRELARLGLRVEEYFQAPCDIEWAWAGDKFSLLQSRPIKGLEDARVIEQVRREEIERLRGLAGGRRCAWVVYNLAETLPCPTPLTWDVVRRFMSGAGGFGLMYQDLGFRPGPFVKQEGFLDLVCGRVYLNTQRHAELFWSGFPWEYDIDAIVKDPSRAEALPTGMDSSRAGFSLLFKLPGLWWAMARSRRLIERLQEDYERTFLESVLPPYLEFVRAKRNEDLAALDAPGLLREFEERRRRVLDEFGKEALKPSYLGSAAFGELQGRLQKALGEEEGRALAGVLASGLENDKTVEANLRLLDVAEGRATLAQFLEEFGHRGHQELELARPRWREDPAFLEQMIAQFRANPEAGPRRLHEQMKARREEAERDLPARLKERGASRLAPEVARLCARVRRYVPYRETAKHYLLLGYELLRRVLLEIDRRCRLEGSVFFLRETELSEALAGRDFSAEIARRQEWRRAELRVHVPEVVTSDDLEAIGRPAEAVEGEGCLKGTGVAPGSGTGPAAVLFDPSEGKGLAPGSVLVCPSTDPGWTPLFWNAAGVVMERGGALSHGAVAARDLGIPAVVIKAATRSIRPGEIIRVDGRQGTATRVGG